METPKSSPDRSRPHLAEMTWPEARCAALNGGRVVLLPVGAIEQHGPHLPVDLDNRIVIWLCEESARRRPDLLMDVPPIHYGFNEHNMAFPGTVTVAIENFINYVTDVCMSFVRQGHERIVLVNGHGSNAALCALVARKVVNASETALAAAINHWDLARELAAEIRESPRGGMAHACEYETSWYLRLCPELVQMDKAVADIVQHQSQSVWVDIMAGDGPVALIDDWSRLSNGSGVEGDPATASREKGERYAETEVHKLIAFCEEFKGMKTKPRRNYTARGTDPNPWFEDSSKPSD